MRLRTLCLSLAMAACGPAPDRTEPTPEVESFGAHLEQVVPELLDRHEVPGAAIALVEGGAVSWQRGFGLADREHGVPVGVDTVFNVASISKSVTAWGVMRLVESRVVTLDEPVVGRLTRWQPAGEEFRRGGITVRRLLSHTAGLSMPSIPGFPDGAELPRLEDNLAGRYRGSIYAEPGSAVELIKEPGTGFAYSGGGYVILQLLLEELTGMPFAGYMQHRVLEPLEMGRSRFGWNHVLAADAAIPYRSSGNPERVYRFAGTAGAGLYSTVGDLARFVAANLDGAEPAGRGVLTPETVRAMFVPVAPIGDDSAPQGAAIGLGFFVTRPPGAGLTLISHSGGNVGWRCLFVAALEPASGIVILTNSDNGEGVIQDVACAWQRRELGLETGELCPQ